MSKHFRIPGSLVLRLRELGIHLPTLLQTSGLSPALLDQPRILVTTEQLFALWRGIARSSANPAIGLVLATETNTANFDPIVLAALSNSSFGEAMHHVARYKQLSCPEELIAENDGVEWSLQFRWLLANDNEPESLSDLCFGWLLNIARHGTGTRLSPLRLELIHPRAYTKILERHFGCPIIYGAVRNAIIFRSSDAALPFVTRNAELFAMLSPQLDQEIQQQSIQDTFPERVLAAIQRKLNGNRPKIQDIARDLHLSSRTLQRRLQDEGYSFQQVLEKARHQLARHYLNNSMLGLTEAAYLLGYEDSNSFVRAFRTWEGVPPALWRDTQRARLAS
jgi:AraC-like DNA-binding protein